MTPTYRLCASDCGDGVTARMQDVMRRKMRQADLFQFIYDNTKMELRNALDEASDSLKAQIIETCSSIRQQLETATGVESKDAARTYPDDFQRVQNALQLAAAKMQRIRDQTASSVDEATRLGYISNVSRMSEEPEALLLCKEDGIHEGLVT